MIKHELLSTYEDFFYIKKEKGQEYAFLDEKTHITVINENFIFGENLKNIYTIKDLNESKNYAMPLTIILKHVKEGQGHFISLLKNREIVAPIIYYRGLNIEIAFDCYNDGIINGESGLIIENFICPDRGVIKELLTKFIYGEYLVKDFFASNNYKKLLDKVNQKMNNNIENETQENINNQGKNNIRCFNEIDDLSELPPIIQIGDMM